MLWMSTKLYKNSCETNIIPKATTEVDWRGGPKDAPTNFEVKATADIDVDRVLSPSELN